MCYFNLKTLRSFGNTHILLHSHNTHSRTHSHTHPQFTCGLTLCCGQAIHLSREEIACVVECFRAPDGRVRYNQFCQFMENGKPISHTHFYLRLTLTSSKAMVTLIQLHIIAGIIQIHFIYPIHSLAFYSI